MGRPRDCSHGMVVHLAGMYSIICGCYARPPVDSLGSRPCVSRISVSNHHRARIFDFIAAEPLHKRSNPHSQRCPDEHQLWIEPGSLSGSSARRLQSSSSLHTSVIEGTTGCVGSSVHRKRGERGERQALLRRGMGGSLLFMTNVAWPHALSLFLLSDRCKVRKCRDAAPH